MKDKGDPVVADTSILIHYLNGDVSARAILEGHRIHISVVTEIELRTISRVRALEQDPILRLLGHCSIWDISPLIKEKCIILRSGRRIKLADSLIASTAIALDLPLATSDKDFTALKDIHEVRLHKPKG